MVTARGIFPAYATVDLAVGHSFGENWSAKLTATNLADNKHYFIDLSNTFGGSHVSDPRMISACSCGIDFITRSDEIDLA